MPSIYGNLRSSYTKYVDTYSKNLVVISSDDADKKNIHTPNSLYDLHLTDGPRCKDNQILTAAYYSSSIPMTVYHLNRFNDTLFLYLPELVSSPAISGFEPGVIPLQLDRRNYTVSTLVEQLQTRLNGLNQLFPNTFDIAVGSGQDTDNRRDGYAEIPLAGRSLTDQTTAGAEGKLIADAVGGAFSIPTPTTASKYRYNSANYNTGPTTGITHEFNVGSLKDASGNVSHLLVKSLPQFEVTKEANERISIKRVDIRGMIPGYGQFYLTGAKRNYHQFGLPKPTILAQNGVPTVAEITRSIYNTSGLFDNTRESGATMVSRFQETEFDTDIKNIRSLVTNTHKASMFFPNFPNLNYMSLITISSSVLRNNSYMNGKQSNVIATIPINVQQGEIINHEPRHLVRTIVSKDEIEKIDIRVADIDGEVLDFNGQPHTITFLIEKWDTVGLPIKRADNMTLTNTNGVSHRERQFPIQMDLTPNPNYYDENTMRRKTRQMLQNAPPVQR
jgi:hypothetical protein